MKGRTRDGTGGGKEVKERPARRAAPKAKNPAHKSVSQVTRPKDRQAERPHPLRRRKGWGDAEVAGWPAGRAASGLEAGESVMPFAGSAANGQTAGHACVSGRLEKFLSSPRRMNQTAVCFGRLLSKGSDGSLAATEFQFCWTSSKRDKPDTREIRRLEESIRAFQAADGG
jgi:hypothetical protein